MNMHRQKLSIGKYRLVTFLEGHSGLQQAIPRE